MKKLFVFACVLMTPALALADIAYPGRKPDPDRYKNMVIPARHTDVQETVLAIFALGAVCGLVEGLHLCWKGYKNPPARTAYALHAAGYGVLTVAMGLSPFILGRAPSAGLPVMLSAIGLFWFLRRMAKKRMPK